MHAAHGRAEQEFSSEIARRHGIQAVAHGPIKAKRLGGHVPVNRKARARQRRRPKRAFIQARAAIRKPGQITRQHFNIGQHVMAESDGLRRLQMGEARHHAARMFFRARDQSAHHILDLLRKPINRIAHPKAHIQGHLVIAGTPRMQALASFPDGLCQPRFDIHVNIFKRVIKGEITGFDAGCDFCEAPADCGLVFCADDPYMPEHGGVG